MNILESLQWGMSRKLPMLLQTEAAECGVACLAMIATYHGHGLDVATLRRRSSVSQKGATAAQLVRIANGLDMASRALRTELDQLPMLAVPCILHWGLNHFVVLKQANSRGIVIHDPAFGIRKMTYAEASDYYTGIAIELTPTPKFEKKQEAQSIKLKNLVGTVVGLRRSLLLVLVLSFSLEVLAILSPFFQQWVMDGVIVSRDRDLLQVLAFGFFMLMLMQMSISTLRSWVVLYFSTTLNLQWVANLFTRLTRLPMSYFEKRHLGDVVSRFGSIQTIRRVLTTTALDAILDGVMAIVGLGMMMLYSVQLATVTLIALTLYILIRWIAYSPYKAANEEQIVHAAKEQTHFIESIRGIQSIKLFNREDERRTQWLNLVVNTTNRGLATEKMNVLFHTANGLVFGIENILVTYLSAKLVMDNQFSIGMMFAYAAYKTQFSSRVGKLVDIFFDIKMLRLQSERLADIVLHEPEPQLDTPEMQREIEPSIELRNIRFRYADTEPWVIDGVSLKIEAGESVVIVGQSGCGKTTLLKILLGLIPPTEGEILIGGSPLKGLGLRNYREMLGAVMQDDQLFAGSIADNVAFFNADHDQERIEAACKLAAIHTEIMAMPMTYQTLIGDMGTAISGGQKQRILLARALYKQPRILFLDEATSHLDVGREREVNDSVRNLRLTRVVIAHRPETIAMAERVIRLSAGKVEQDFRQVPNLREANV
ncbi:peptidase domain-containing ABC transporter [Parachitinimonas caeni]|uniref:Peptidase domain-containing ABC transporter n=1 Tax=Parachitinimonas caeni TaxID=3031301 RepID=A0ABT7DR80_9NEIS|nr:peptidase domain-containing ABC transporter [Parachitinimonas caeni]MDK2122578.1 peptidase domain-containing ABC transporter [Parachitinimonas caeni]